MQIYINKLTYICVYLICLYVCMCNTGQHFFFLFIILHKRLHALCGNKFFLSFFSFFFFCFFFFFFLKNELHYRTHNIFADFVIADVGVVVVAVAVVVVVAVAFPLTACDDVDDAGPLNILPLSDLHYKI